MLSPTLSAPAPHPSSDGNTGNNSTTNNNNLSPTTRRRGLSYLRALSSRDHNTTGSSDSQPSPSRPSPRHFFSRSTSYQDTKNNRSTEGRRRSQSHSRPYDALAGSVALARVASERGANSTQQPETATPTLAATADVASDPPTEQLPNTDGTTTSRPDSSVVQITDTNPEDAAMSRNVSGTAANGDTDNKQGPPTIRFFPHQDHNRLGRQSLNFSPISRTLPNERSIIRVGRYSEREGPPVSNPTGPSEAPVGFKSKVVSRKHCEFSFVDGQWQIRDVSSSSGTFLNHIRLSQPNQESRLFPIKDGDIVQLGIDFRGGEEMIFRCVKIRIECNRAWQKKPNQFNKTRRAQLLGLTKDQPANTNSGECSICLGNVLPCQALFVAPCAHVWHYKCIRPMLEGRNSQYPSFQCPNCRAFSDLEADVDIDMEEWDKEEAENEEIDVDTNETGELEHRDHTDSADHETPQASPRRSEENHDANGSGTSNGTQNAEASTPIATPQTTTNTTGLLSRRQDRPTMSTASPTGHLSPPVNIIAMPKRPTEAEMQDLLTQQRTNVETPNGELVISGEGPLTPRNNAGPFVFDGSGSRTGSRRNLAVPESRSLNELGDGTD